MFFDSHAHYDDESFDNDRDLVIKKVYDSGIKLIINPSSSIHSVTKVVDLSNKYDFIYAAIGVDPNNLQNMNNEVFSNIVKLSENDKVIAIGEIGLDYHYNLDKETQKYWYKKQIQLAVQSKLPIIVHDREAHQDCFDILKECDAQSVGGIFHCYSGSVEMARELIKNNFLISISGIVTFKNARKIVEIVENIPLDKLVIETDSPYLSPEPNRGKRNDSTNIPIIAQKIAEIKNVDVNIVAKITNQNIENLFNIKC